VEVSSLAAIGTQRALVPRLDALPGPRPQRKDSVAWLDSDIAAWAESRAGPPVEDIALAHRPSQFTVGVMLDRNLNTGDDWGVDE
jgi:hypothetical protein